MRKATEVNVGLPGTGLGTLLYLLLALAMPVRFLVRLARGRAGPGEGRLVARQTALELGIVLSVAATAAGRGALLLRFRSERVAGPVSAVVARVGEASPVQVSVVLLTFAVLTVVLLAIELLGLLAGPARRR